ncbi:MAG: pyridoxal-phosphate dependent enzyme [Actinobacteria bacterium]|nr:pyridoxal-phosphate dependent enzyme [Actinomycetota bacterium]
MAGKAYPEITAAQLLPRVIALGGNLYAAAFTLMKLVPARFILRKALESGRLGPDTVLVETTSGTFGLALAMQAALLRRRLILVSDPVIDANLRRRLVDLGAEVEICPRPTPEGGFQGARLARLAELRETYPDHLCPEQYSNPDNPASYSIVADHLTDVLGTVDCVVGAVGSGGSMCGTVRALRTAHPQVQAIAVDTQDSVLFGHPDGPRAVRGLGNSLLPANLDHQIFDQVHWCPAGDVFAATRQLHRDHALFQGPTSGAAYAVARWWADRHPDARCVVLLPDEGYRYADTVYNDQWLLDNGYRGARRGEPVQVPDPAHPTAAWSWFSWERRGLRELLGADRSGSAAALEVAS